MMSRFLDALSAKNADAFNARPVTLAFLGDSVTNGCFEVFQTLNEAGEEGLNTFFEPKNSYAEDLHKILHTFYPCAQINLVNAGISGDNAPNGLARLSRDILPSKPDLTVVCYGLNDSGAGDDGIAAYKEALIGIAKTLRDNGSEVIIMTPQPTCTKVHERLLVTRFRELAKEMSDRFESGCFDRYMQAARDAARQSDVALCDCYAKWMKLRNNGVDTTGLLANLLNHPTREMHWLFAVSLAETIFNM